jgi:hypothetical protein
MISKDDGKRAIADFVNRTLLWHKSGNAIRKLIKGTRVPGDADVKRVTMQAIYLILVATLSYITRKFQRLTKNPDPSSLQDDCHQQVIEALDKFISKLSALGKFHVNKDDANKQNDKEDESRRTVKRSRLDTEEDRGGKKDHDDKNIKLLNIAKNALGSCYQFAEEVNISSFHMKVVDIGYLLLEINHKAVSHFKTITDYLGLTGSDHRSNVREILRDWRRDKDLKYLRILGSVFDQHNEAALQYEYQVAMYGTEDLLHDNDHGNDKWLLFLNMLNFYLPKLNCMSLIDANVRSLYAMMMLAAIAARYTHKWNHITYGIVPTYCLMALYDPNEKHIYIYQQHHKNEDDEERRGWETQLPRPSGDRRFHWVRSAPKRFLLQRFADRCPYEAKGKNPGENVDVYHLDAFDEFHDPLDLDDFVKVTGGHCYKLSGLMKQIHQTTGGRVRDPLMGHMLPDAEIDRIRSVAQDDTWTIFESALIFLDYPGKLYDMDRLKAFCKNLSKTKSHDDSLPENNKAGSALLVQTKLVDHRHPGSGKRAYFTKVRAGLVTIAQNRNGPLVKLTFPENAAGRKLLSMFLAIASLVHTGDQATEFLALFSACLARGEDDMSISDLLSCHEAFTDISDPHAQKPDDPKWRNGTAILSAMYTTYALYKMLKIGKR